MSVVVVKLEVFKVRLVRRIATVLIGIVRDQVAEVRNALGATVKVGKALLAMVAVSIVLPKFVVFGSIEMAKVMATCEVVRVRTTWAAAKVMAMSISKVIDPPRGRGSLTNIR